MITASLDVLEKLFNKHHTIAFRNALDEAAVKGLVVHPIEDSSALNLAESLFVIELTNHFPMMAILRKSIIRSHVESIGLTYDKNESYWALELVEDFEPSIGVNNKTLSFSKRIKVDKIAAFCDMLNGMRYKKSSADTRENYCCRQYFQASIHSFVEKLVKYLRSRG